MLRNFGLKIGLVGKIKFEERINELVKDRPDLREIMQPLLTARKLLRDAFTKLHKKVLDLVREDEVCRRLTTIPGAGPVVALTYKATIDIPARFAYAKAVGSVLGLTPKLNESGESKRVGRVSCLR
ncbi:IS110 family insertion sequence transposase domain-containing protein (plasmid) [Rhizobium sp. NXC24]|nr:IS110 family insertion sequence transposase domain-containing protein [Rhizobium sp. NXC24]